ncbi:M20 metallopeptidase family protein [Oceanobacillus polygoni]|uniref:Amidohydrolase n=1 Tax=Oceanobacillus polygoni TaxID=1235259 RepID=A0A9X0YU10_9BACI|nr:M20 family metallopeptidase [Oceanobacillus polygoni]MBP2078840.1 amidohydrolase [Oceanobacillus polygoni]
MQHKIEAIMNQIEEEVIANRRHLHQYPELSNQEKETSHYIQEKLTEYGISFETGYATHGVLGIIKGKKPGKTVALRADIDALPIQELNNHDFASTHPNVMHACGHDAHTAMLLGAGCILQQMQEELHGTILLVFQPAEEASPVGGAQVMMDDGVFDTYTPDVIFGQHVWPSMPAGTVGVHDREVMGASDRFKVVLEGKGGHASMPHQTNDAVIATGHLITALQTIVSRNLDPMEASVVTISMLEAGSVPNIIPREVTIQGSIRTYDAEIREKLKERFFQITNQIAAAFGVKAQIEYVEGYPATINTPKWAQLARNSVQKVLGEEATPAQQPALAGEDFGRFLQKYPGAFIWLGTQIEDKDNQAPLHDANFKLNERALPNGTKLLAQLAIDALQKLNEE